MRIYSLAAVGGWREHAYGICLRFRRQRPLFWILFLALLAEGGRLILHHHLIALTSGKEKH
jgi:hypothetical protein